VIRASDWWPTGQVASLTPAVRCRVSTAAGKPSRYVTSHPGQLSLPSLWDRVNRVPACLAGVTAGCVHLCRVEGKTTWSRVSSNTPYSCEITCSGSRRSVVVSGVGLINEVNRHRARLVLGWVTDRLRYVTTNKPPRSTQPSIPLGSSKLSTSLSGWG